MTNNEIKEVLKTVSRLVNVMDKAHVKNLLEILTGAQYKENCAPFVYKDRKIAKMLLSDLIRNDHVRDCLTHKCMKQIFAIMGDYEIYPTCKLCGHPIKINTESLDLGQVAFSWDHQLPKSKGGTYDLSNLQPTHKICNNLRGTKPLYSGHYKLKIDIDIDVEVGKNGVCVPGNLRYDVSRIGSCKQSAWPYKQFYQKHR
jgi:5-methylcytosine-specific restriction endonuclease McrA